MDTETLREILKIWAEGVTLITGLGQAGMMPDGTDFDASFHFDGKTVDFNITVRPEHENKAAWEAVRGRNEEVQTKPHTSEIGSDVEVYTGERDAEG